MVRVRGRAKSGLSSVEEEVVRRAGDVGILGEVMFVVKVARVKAVVVVLGDGCVEAVAVV